MSAELNKAVAALKNILKLIEEKELVRNTENDQDIMLFMKQGKKITLILQEAIELCGESKKENEC